MKKIKIFVGALLCMNLLTISGCDKVVHSAVVEEKDKTVVKTEENKEKETVQKTVAEQVQAPETYQTTIQADLRSADREDKETPMNFTLTADAPVKVPDVDAICLKKVKRLAIPEEEQNKIKDTFGKRPFFTLNSNTHSNQAFTCGILNGTSHRGIVLLHHSNSLRMCINRRSLRQHSHSRQGNKPELIVPTYPSQQ